MAIKLGTTDITVLNLGGVSVPQAYMGAVPLLDTGIPGVAPDHWRMENVAPGSSGGGNRNWRIPLLEFFIDNVLEPDSGNYDLKAAWTAPANAFDGSSATLAECTEGTLISRQAAIGQEYLVGKPINKAIFSNIKNTGGSLPEPSLAEFQASEDGILPYTVRGAFLSIDGSEEFARVISVDPYENPVKGVLERYEGLTAGETAAITAFVEGCVADGIWTRVQEVFMFGLTSAANSLIGMRRLAATTHTTGAAVLNPVHVPQKGWLLDAVAVDNGAYLEIGSDMGEIFQSISRGLVGIYITEGTAGAGSDFLFGGQPALDGSDTRVAMNYEDGVAVTATLWIAGALPGPAAASLPLGTPIQASSNNDLLLSVSQGQVVEQSSSETSPPRALANIGTAKFVINGVWNTTDPPVQLMSGGGYTPGLFWLAQFDDETTRAGQDARMQELAARIKTLATGLGYPA